MHDLYIAVPIQCMTYTSIKISVEHGVHKYIIMDSWVQKFNLGIAYKWLLFILTIGKKEKNSRVKHLMLPMWTLPWIFLTSMTFTNSSSDTLPKNRICVERIEDRVSLPIPSLLLSLSLSLSADRLTSSSCHDWSCFVILHFAFHFWAANFSCVSIKSIPLFLTTPTRPWIYKKNHQYYKEREVP